MIFSAQPAPEVANEAVKQEADNPSRQDENLSDNPPDVSGLPRQKMLCATMYYYVLLYTTTQHYVLLCTTMCY